MSQSSVDQNMVALHKKRESSSLVDYELYFEDTLITQHGLNDARSLFSEYSAENPLDDEGAEQLAKVNFPLQQEFARKYLLPRNIRNYEKNHQQIDEYNAKFEIDSAMFQIPRTEPFKRISAGELYRYGKYL